MTLSTTASRVTYAGNGATTSFAFAFKIWAQSDLKIYLRDNASLVDTLQTLTTHYTISATLPGTGNVVFVTAPASGKTIVIVRDAAPTQDLDLTPNGAFAADNVEIAFDKLASFVQALQEQIGRAPLLPVGSALANLALPEPRAAIANNLIAVNASGDSLTAVATSTLSAGQTVTAFVQTVLDDINSQTLFATLGFLSGTAIWNIPSTADNASATTTVTVTGAALGDWVAGISGDGNLLGLNLSGQVTGANTVTVTAQNDTGSTQDPASMTIFALVLKKSSLGL